MGSSGSMAEARVHAMFMQRASISHMPPDVAEARFTAFLPELRAQRDASMKEQARIYAKYFSTSELYEIGHFYKTFYTSPVGEKVIVNQAAINSEYAAVSGKLTRDFIAHLWASADAQSSREVHSPGDVK